MKNALRCGFAVALVTGCGPAGSRRAEVPTPDDPVSVGYQTESRRDATGAVTSFSPTEADARFLAQALPRLPGSQPETGVAGCSGRQSVSANCAAWLVGRTAYVGAPQCLSTVRC